MMNEDDGRERAANGRPTHLLVYSVDLSILRLNLASHVDGHIAQIADHCRHLTHIILHLFLSIVVCDPVLVRNRIFVSRHLKIYRKEEENRENRQNLPRNMIE